MANWSVCILMVLGHLHSLISLPSSALHKFNQGPTLYTIIGTLALLLSISKRTLTALKAPFNRPQPQIRNSRLPETSSSSLMTGLATLHHQHHPVALW